MTALRAVVIGPMAAGKSTVGRELARLWKVDFHDLDHLIAEFEQLTVPQIFAEHGEEYFRQREVDVLEQMARTGTGVLSVGGGAPMNPAAAQILRGLPVVMIDVTPEVVAARIARRPGARPLLNTADPLATWRQIYAERAPVYRDLATCVVMSTNSAPIVTARAIDAALQHTSGEESL